MAEKVEIAVVTRTYAGTEGTRVKAGTRFAVGKEQGGLPVISMARYNQLKGNNLVRPFSDQDTKAAAKYERPLERRQVIQQPQGNAASPSAQKVRQAARARIKQTENPSPPKQVKGPQRGSQTGGEKSASSSPAAPLSTSSILPGSGEKKPRARGNRAAAPSSGSSPSITPTR